MGVSNFCNCQSNGRFTFTDGDFIVLHFFICPDCQLQNSFISFSIISEGFADFSFDAQTFNLPTCTENTLSTSGTGFTTGNDLSEDVTGPTDYTFTVDQNNGTDLTLTFQNNTAFTLSVQGFPVNDCTSGISRFTNNTISSSGKISIKGNGRELTLPIPKK